MRIIYSVVSLGHPDAPYLVVRASLNQYLVTCRQKELQQVIILGELIYIALDDYLLCSLIPDRCIEVPDLTS